MTKPTVAIVGRPNVGKSTLFNRIIRRREAIVDGTPGITRDRKSAEAEWEGVSFTLMDTGGYVPRGSDVIEDGVTRQVRLAMAESDLIVFLADCTSGITDVDGEVARLLRKSEKQTLLVVNKADTPNRELEAAEFVRLGLGEPIPVSALRGRGIGDLLSLIVSRLDHDIPPQEDEEDGAVRLAVIGRPNVGKSTFVNTMLGEERMLVTEIPGTTRDPVDVRIRFEDEDFVLIDTAGMRRRSRIKENVEYYSTLRTHRVLEKCDVACVFADADDGLTQQDLRVLRETIDAKKGVVLVVNKWDLVEEEGERVMEWEQMLENRLHGMAYVPILFVSCITASGVEEALRMARRIRDEREKRIPSAALNRLIEELNRTYQPPAVQGKRIRVLYATQAGVRPPRFVFFSNFPHLVKDNYKGFLEHRIREEFGFEGVPLTLVFKKK